ncbi:MAG TPA: polysaccharide biosynthesis protein [Candidatus Egerieimonas intestinavium]|uniref:Polysaccharide biosynthesis protein n=1 Tax=Candidatus Egerieimonas intestinavium TaxID=2840777 RepID=A0A9D1EJ50_9FIRM|nr:polysaccharide biosynthesis protein [Candidatus Egerieimonas intestinavium]
MSKKNSFVKQASFLMIAGLLVRVIGLLYRPLMKANIGELGYAYYGYAYNVYFILLLISGYSIPVAVSKLMSERLAKKQYRNAQKVFQGSLAYVLLVGGLASLAAFVFARQLLPKGGEDAVLALRVLAPTILLAGILGVLRGYFQAHNNMLPTSISQILESLVNAVVAISMGAVFIKLFATDENTHAIYGAAGSTMGPGAGVVIGILFMLLVFTVNRGYIKRTIARDRTGQEETWGDIARVILMMLTPVIFSTCLYNISAYINQTVFAPLMIGKGFDGKEVAKMYSQFNNMYLVLINVPIALANSSSTAMIPAVTGNYALGKFQEAKNQIDQGIRMTMFIAIPAAVGLSVLAFPIMRLLFGANTDMAGWMLVTGGVAVLFYSLSTITNGVLQGIGKQTIPLRNAAISLVADVVILVVLTKFTALGAYSVMIANLAYGIIMCVLNQLALRKHLHYRNEYRKTYLEPLAAAAGMGIVAWMVYYALSIVVKSNILCLIPAIGLAVITYLLLYVKVSHISPQELQRFPMGTRLVAVLRKIRMI